MKHNKDISKLKERIFSEPDYINSKKYGYSLDKFLEQHPNGVPDNIISVLLCISVEEVQDHFGTSVTTLRKAFKI